MRKKIVLVVLISFVFIASSFASLLQIGPSFTYNKPMVDSSFEDFKEFNSSNISFGGDFRLNILKFQLAAKAGIGFLVGGDTNALTLNTNLTLNARFTLSIFEILLGLGTNMDFMYVGESKTWFLNGLDFDNFSDALGKSQLIYRAGLGFNFGKVGLGFEAIIPTNGTFTEDFTLLPDWDSTKISASVLFSFL